MIFDDRSDAGERLAIALAQWRGKHALILAIPRGAVPMGAIVAERLGGDLDVVLTRKLGAPGNPEFAIGAVDESGWTYMANHAESTGATREYIEREVAAQLETMRRRRAQYTPARAPLDPAGRIAIVVDDGLATGATMITALHSVAAKHPQRLVCAVPVGAREAVERVRPHADDVVCLDPSMEFFAISQCYRSFPQVDDDEVVAILQQH
ncbi:MAG: phosphoribosyltransferase [Betaproteobacteria bacterium]|nr:MAG: phosphoribosyltransferase [Betaproteobacteria bacterium]